MKNGLLPALLSTMGDYYKTKDMKFCQISNDALYLPLLHDKIEGALLLYIPQLSNISKQVMRTELLYSK